MIRLAMTWFRLRGHSFVAKKQCPRSTPWGELNFYDLCGGRRRKGDKSNYSLTRGVFFGSFRWHATIGTLRPRGMIIHVLCRGNAWYRIFGDEAGYAALEFHARGQFDEVNVVTVSRE